MAPDASWSRRSGDVASTIRRGERHRTPRVIPPRAPEGLDVELEPDAGRRVPLDSPPIGEMIHEVHPPARVRKRTAGIRYLVAPAGIGDLDPDVPSAETHLH